MAKEETVEKAKTTEGPVDHKKPKRKKSPKQEEIDHLRIENQSLQEQLLRKIAEFENYKKRSEREYLTLIQNASERLITNLLPVLDDFDRSLAHAKESEDLKSLRDGMELIQKKLTATLEKEGLKKMKSVGEEFDPDKHDALLQVENPDAESGTIVEEHLTGYTLNDKVIRHSQVIVAK